MIILDGVVLNFDDLLKLAIAITGIWGFVKVIMEIIKAITARHDKEQAWDKAVKDIEVDRESLKTELKKVKKEQETARISEEIKMRNKKINETEMNNGGYCSLNCAHCYEEFLDSGGGIVGDFDSEGCVDYYCRLGHSIAFGRFCDDYR